MKRFLLLIFMLLMLMGCKEYDSLIKPVNISAAYNPDINPSNFDKKCNADFGWKSEDVLNRREINWLKIEFESGEVAGKYLLTPSSRFAYRVMFNNEVYHPFSGDNKALYAKSYRSHPYIFKIEEDINTIYIYFERSSMHYGFMYDEVVIGAKKDIYDLALSMNKLKLINDQIDFYGAVNLSIIGLLSVLIFILVNRKMYPILIFGLTLLASGTFHLRISPFSVYLHDPSIGRRVSIFGFLFIYYVLFILFSNSFFKIKNKFINIILACITLLAFVSAMFFDHSFQFAKISFLAFNVVLVIQVIKAMSYNMDMGKTVKIVLSLSYIFNALLLLYGALDLHFKLKIFISPLAIGSNAIALAMVYYLIKEYRSQVLELEYSKLQLVALQKENLTAELDLLKQQIDPHFLFNSLSTLITLIEESQSAAQDFVQELSKVYRYILQIKDKDLIEVRKELQFVESYKFLLAQRFRENLKLDIDIDDKHMDRILIPAAIQMLVENCVKHNEISSDKPLSVKISSDDKYIKVTNNLQPKIGTDDSEKIGLENLRKRFSHYTDLKLEINKTETEFSVKIPMFEEIE